MSTPDSKGTTPTVKKEEFTYPATEKGTLVLSIGLQRQIEWLHKQVGAKEWCGVLFYKRLDGDIDNPKNLKLYASDIYLMDIGRETYTEADFDANTAVEMWEMVNDDYTFKRGLIHTHHNMTTFFSGTDMQELHDNTGTHNYYLSLIVNFSGVYTAKVAFVAKRKTQVEYTNVDDEKKDYVTEKELLMMIDMNIIKEAEEVAVPDFFRTRHEALKTQIEERATAQASKHTTVSITHEGIGQRSLGWQDDDDDDWTGVGSVSGPAISSYRGSASATKTEGTSSITKEGYLQKGSQILKPLGKVEMNITEAILRWLNDGTRIYSDMIQGNFANIVDAIQYFKDYFDEPTHDLAQYKWYIDQMQRDMIFKFKKWYSTLVQRVGMESMDIIMINNPLAADIYEMFQSYPQYVNEMGYVEDNAKKQEKGKHNSKQRQKVNGRGKHK